MPKTAIIDLGTNTFHLFIAEVSGKNLRTLYKEKIAVKIGRNGISRGKIAADAQKRALHALKIFKNVIDQFGVDDVRGVATSAIRNAKNGQELLDKIKESTGIKIEVISGDREAELIYFGVKAAIKLKSRPQLIMDIGGGSVEFIIGNDTEILWKQSFEIGAQRLLDRFHKVDPIQEDSIVEMNSFLEIELADLIEAIREYNPTGLIGCSGTFDTLKEIYFSANKLEASSDSRYFVLPKQAYNTIHLDLVTKNRQERLSIPGMVTMRVDMIVVASSLINFVLRFMDIPEIVSCTFALKEGVLFHNNEGATIIN